MSKKKIKHLNDITAIARYLKRIGAEPRSLRTAVVKEQHGAYWQDVAVIHFTPEGEVNAPPHFEPTEAEAAAIKEECAAAAWPAHMKPLGGATILPEELKHVDPESLFWFRDEEGAVIMIQQRIEEEVGKAYVPWTYWDDGEWRRMEPDGKLPLWGIEQLKKNAVVFIHEGAKAARSMARMIAAETPEEKERLKQHPWGEELQYAAHIGWIGGALSPARTDWGILKRLDIKRAYIVSDNDDPGVTAVPAIAYQLRIPTFHVQFTSEWPVSFDLADPFPKKMFTKMNGVTYYVGPSFRSCLHPATWATDQINNPKSKSSKPVTVLRDEFKKMWAYVEEADMFVNKEMPEILRNDAILNKMLASFSHITNIASLMIKSYKGRTTKLCYRPDIPGRIVTDRTTAAINQHTPTHIRKTKGDPQPWLDFLRYMFPNEEERTQVERWCATLIARPDIRMEYGLLLVSETQGIGKTTLGAKILAPLVGDHNVGFPSEDDITNSQFNGWIANKRLVIVGEIYSGHSWKAYNRLKSYITDKDIDFNQKYMRPYRVENWVHIVACSNSRKALKMEEKDRRWFYPTVAEVAWTRQKFVAFNEWIQSGGLQIIRYWAENHKNYVMPGERAPMTDLKKQMIADSRSEAQQELADLCEALREDNVVVALAMKELRSWLRAKLGANKVFETDYELRKVAADLGFTIFDKRIKVGSQMQYVLLSPALVEKLNGNAEDTSAIRSAIKYPADLIQSDM